MPLGSDLHRQQLIVAAAYVVNVVDIAATLYVAPLYWKQAYHTSREQHGLGYPAQVMGMGTDGCGYR